MSMSINSMQTVEVRTDHTKMVVYDVDRQEYRIYPEGVGRGPCMMVDRADWARLVAAAARALSEAVTIHPSYSACEGNGAEL